MANGYTSAERRANARAQLRDRKGRWVNMGSKVRFLLNGVERVGEISAIHRGNEADVSYRDNDGLKTHRVVGSDIDIVPSKASIDRNNDSAEGRIAVTPDAAETRENKDGSGDESRSVSGDSDNITAIDDDDDADDSRTSTPRAILPSNESSDESSTDLSPDEMASPELGSPLTDVRQVDDAPDGTRVSNSKTGVSFSKLPGRGWRDDDLNEISAEELANDGAFVEDPDSVPSDSAVKSFIDGDIVEITDPTGGTELADSIEGDDDTSEFMRDALNAPAAVKGASVFVKRDREDIVGVASITHGSFDPSEFDRNGESFDYVKLDRLAAKDGSKSSGPLLDSVMSKALDDNKGFLVETSDEHADYWENDQGLTRDPYNVGIDAYGLTPEQIQSRFEADDRDVTDTPDILHQDSREDLAPSSELLGDTAGAIERLDNATIGKIVADADGNEYRKVNDSDSPWRDESQEPLSSAELAGRGADVDAADVDTDDTSTDDTSSTPITSQRDDADLPQSTENDAEDPTGTPANVTTSTSERDSLRPEMGEVKEDDDGSEYVSSASGEPVMEGDRVRSTDEDVEGVVTEIIDGDTVRVQDDETGDVVAKDLVDLEKVVADDVNAIAPSDGGGGGDRNDIDAVPDVNDNDAVDDEIEIRPGLFESEATGRRYVKNSNGSRFYVNGTVTDGDKRYQVKAVYLHKDRPVVNLAEIEENGSANNTFLATADDLDTLHPEEDLPTITDRTVTPESLGLSFGEYAAQMYADGNYELAGAPDQGAMGAVHFINLPDGSNAVVKTVTGMHWYSWAPEGSLTKDEALVDELDAEYLGAKVAEAIGIPEISSAKVPGSNNKVVHKTVPGQDAYSTIEGTELESRADDVLNYVGAEDVSNDALFETVRAEGGKNIALYDYLTGYEDRHMGNWFVDENGVYPVDFGASWIDTSDFDTSGPSPFYYFWFNSYYWPDNAWTAEELKEVHSQLVNVERDFTESGKLHWYTLTMSRLESLIGALDEEGALK